MTCAVEETLEMITSHQSRLVEKLLRSFRARGCRSVIHGDAEAIVNTILGEIERLAAAEVQP